MNSKNFDVPYPIGTYLTRNENGVEHFDQVKKYVLSNEGLFVILMLEYCLKIVRYLVQYLTLQATYTFFKFYNNIYTLFHQISFLYLYLKLLI